MPKGQTQTALATSADVSLTTELKENENLIILEVINLTKKYINSACYVFSRNFKHLTIDDLKQECYIKIISIVREKADVSFSETVEICKTSCYNLLKDVYRKEQYRRTESHHKGTSDEDDESIYFNDVPSTENLDEFIDHMDVLLALEKRINGIDAKVLRMLVSPDLELVSLAQKANVDANAEREKGKLKMNINQVKITAKIIAQRLGISPATVSRSLKKINLIISELLNDGESEVSY